MPTAWGSSATTRRRPNGIGWLRSAAIARPCSRSPCCISAAAYDLGLLYIEGQLFPQDFARAAELFRSAAQVGNAEAQYALATLYKEGRGVPKDLVEAVRLLATASLADNTDAQVEYAIALFNGTGVAKNERLAAVLLAKAARKGN